MRVNKIVASVVGGSMLASAYIGIGAGLASAGPTLVFHSISRGQCTAGGGTVVNNVDPNGPGGEYPGPDLQCSGGRYDGQAVD